MNPASFCAATWGPLNYPEYKKIVSKYVCSQRPKSGRQSKKYGAKDAQERDREKRLVFGQRGRCSGLVFIFPRH